MITQKSDDQSFCNIAVSHAHKTIVNHYRPNYSSIIVSHVAITGFPHKKQRYPGYSDESLLSRGQEDKTVGVVHLF